MSTRVILTIVFISFGLIAAILPEKDYSSQELDAKQLLHEIQVENYMISADEIAEALINEDPEYQLIDVRSEEEFKQYSLPGAINIPFEKLFDEESLAYIDQIARKNVFYSNGTTKASEAWMLAKQKGFQNNYILRGGLNNWYKTIIEPNEPASADDVEAYYEYQARLGAKQFFTGQGAAQSSGAKKKARAPIKRKKKKMVAGGCS